MPSLRNCTDDSHENERLDITLRGSRQCCLCFSSPFCFDDGEPLLQLLFVLGPQRVEALELGAAELGLEHQLIPAAHETGCVVPTVNQTQLGLLRVHRFLGHADLVLRGGRGNGGCEAITRLKVFFDEKKIDLKTFSIFCSQPLHVLRFDLAYSTANSVSVFSPLAPPFASPFPVWTKMRNEAANMLVAHLNETFCERNIWCLTSTSN